MTFKGLPMLVLNGRMMTRPLKGVGRVAAELSGALLRLHAAGQGPEVYIARPAAPVHDPDSWPGLLHSLKVVSTAPRNGHLWEQLELARVAPKGWQLNLCNTGPVLRSRQVLMIHDAQAFRQTASYSLVFRLFYRVLLPLIAKRARILTTVSDFSRHELEALGVFPKGKAHVVHNGVDHFDRIIPDPATLRRHALTDGGYFLALGSLAPHKNLKRLLEAARARPTGALPLIIAGGQNSRIFRDEGLSAGNGVHFIGRVSDAELKALYGSARALVFPSITEGFGLPPLEAMSCGCPVIATTGGAVPEVCGEAAIYADPLAPDEWTDAMMKLECDEQLVEALSIRGRAHAAGFTWQKAAEQILQLIAESERRDQAG